MPSPGAATSTQEPKLLKLASLAAQILTGKRKPSYTPFLDTGDHVIVINASHIALTGRKPQDKKWFAHTMYPGGSYWIQLKEEMQKHPDRVVHRAVRGMMPKTKLGRAMISKLKIYPGAVSRRAREFQRRQRS